MRARCVLGNGSDDRAQMGPSVSESQLETVMKVRGDWSHSKVPVL